MLKNPNRVSWLVDEKLDYQPRKRKEAGRIENDINAIDTSKTEAARGKPKTKSTYTFVTRLVTSVKFFSFKKCRKRKTRFSSRKLFRIRAGKAIEHLLGKFQSTPLTPLHDGEIFFLGGISVMSYIDFLEKFSHCQ